MPADDHDGGGLALERTSLAWSRAGLSAAVTGLLAGRALFPVSPVVGVAVCAGFLAVAASCGWQGRRGYHRVETAPERRPLLRLVAWSTAALALLAGGLDAFAR